MAAAGPSAWRWWKGGRRWGGRAARVAATRPGLPAVHPSDGEVGSSSSSSSSADARSRASAAAQPSQPVQLLTVQDVPQPTNGRSQAQGRRAATVPERLPPRRCPLLPPAPSSTAGPRSTTSSACSSCLRSSGWTRVGGRDEGGGGGRDDDEPDFMCASPALPHAGPSSRASRQLRSQPALQVRQGIIVAFLLRDLSGFQKPVVCQSWRGAWPPSLPPRTGPPPPPPPAIKSLQAIDGLLPTCTHLLPLPLCHRPAGAAPRLRHHLHDRAGERVPRGVLLLQQARRGEETRRFFPALGGLNPGDGTRRRDGWSSACRAARATHPLRTSLLRRRRSLLRLHSAGSTPPGSSTFATTVPPAAPPPPPPTCGVSGARCRSACRWAARDPHPAPSLSPTSLCANRACGRPRCSAAAASPPGSPPPLPIRCCRPSCVCPISPASTAGHLPGARPVDKLARGRRDARRAGRLAQHPAVQPA